MGFTNPFINPYAIASTDVVIYQREEVDTGPVTLPLKYAGNMPYLSVQFTGPAARSQIFLQWYADAQGQNLIGSDSITIKSSAGAGYVNLPVKGPYLDAFIQQSAYPNDVFLKVLSAPVPTAQWSEFGWNRVLNGIGTVVGAAATVTVNAQNVVLGWVNVFAEAVGATNVEARLFLRTFNNSRVEMLRWQIAGPQQSRNIYVPPSPLEIDLVNADASARTVNVSILRGTPGVA